jgi:cytochrome bd-type quinol oxidase subunit 2
MGSAVSIALGLLMTGAVFLLLNDSDSRLADESRPLMATTLVSVLLAAVAAASFYGQLRQRRWRYLAHAALLAGMAFAGWTYWPRK